MVSAKDVVLVTRPQELQPYGSVAARYPKGATWALRIPDAYAPGLYDVMAGKNPASGTGDQVSLQFHWPSMEPAEKHKTRIALLPSGRPNIARALPAWPYVTDRSDEFFFTVTVSASYADHALVKRKAAEDVAVRTRCTFEAFATGGFTLIAKTGGPCDLAHPLGLAFVRSSGPTPLYQFGANEINQLPRPAGSLTSGRGVLKGRDVQLSIPIRELASADAVMAAAIRFLEQHTIRVDDLEPPT